MKRLLAGLLLLLFAAMALPAENGAPLKFGVLAVRPKVQAMTQWQPLAAYLETALQRRVELAVYGFDELNAAVDRNAVDVLLTNPGHYILLQHRKQLSAPLATLVTLEADHELSAFGGVIFARSDKSTIDSLADLAGKYVAATNRESFGGYQMQAVALLEAGVAPPENDKLLATGMPHDQVAYAVLDGRVDAGFVRSGVLEAMAREGRLNLGNFKIIRQQDLPSFPYASSTRLYPEWPVVVMPQIDQSLARSLAIALLALPADSPAARAIGIRGFTIPADYGGVEDVLRRLRMPPFDAAPYFTFTDLWKRYAGGISALLGVLVVVLAGMGAQLLAQNRRVLQGQKHFATLFEFSPEPTWIIANGRFIDCNMAAVRLLGYGDKSLVLNRSPGELSPSRQPDGVDSLTTCERIFGAAAAGEPQRFEWVFLKADDSEFFADVSLAPTKLDEIDVVLCVWRDITERKRADAHQKLAASVFTHAREAITITDADATIIDVNDTFTQITGYSRDEVVGRNPRILKSGRQGPEFYTAMWQALTAHGHWTGEIWNRRKNGEVYAEMLTISAVRDAEGKAQNYVALFTDITSVKEHQKQLEHIAHFDALTSLPNRVLLSDRLQHAMVQSQRRGRSLAVAYLDLDGFKAVNDNHGHDVGDELLIAVAQRMKTALREGDTLARIGGDEFVAVLVDLEQPQDCEPVLARLLQATAAQVTVDDTLLQVSASIGVTLYPQDGADADQLMRHADQAMYLAKQAGKNRYHLFDVDQDAAVKTQRESLEHIRRALDRREFVLHYQPKVNMETGAVIGAEALIRWQHPERGLLSPAAFLPVIEGHPISIELGEWVIDTALSQLSQWHAMGLNIPVSVNIGARQLQRGDFEKRLAELLAAHPDVQSDRLELEVLETSALEDVANVSELMHACRKLGVRFALDDFGTGYSSLTYLKRLPVDLLKIDQSFVRGMLDDPDDLAIVKGVMGLATAFRREVIAEGVETVAHGELLLPLGCVLAQGFGIARPMAGTDLPAWAASWQPDVAWTAWRERTLSYDNLALVSAEVEHRHWLRVFEIYLAGNRNIPPPLSAHECHFGRWQETEGRTRFGEHPRFSELVAVHEHVHALGRELVEMHARGQTVEALARLGELHILRNELIGKLRVLVRGEEDRLAC